MTVVWYAMPDFIKSRRSRLLSKTSLLLGAGAYAFHEVRSERRAAEPSMPSIDQRTDDGTPTKFGYVAVFTAALATILLMLGTLVGASKAERAIFTIGEKLKQGGMTWPHTRIGIVLGCITATFNWGASRMDNDPQL